MTTATETPAAVEPSVEEESRWSRAPMYLFISLIALLWTIPSLGLLVNSFRESNSVRGRGWWTLFSTDGGWWKIWTLPGHLFDAANWTLGNYREVLSGQGFGNAFANSLAVTIPAVVIPITIAAFAAYAFSWMHFPGRQVLFALVVGLMVVPLQMALIPILRMYTSFHVNGTFPAVWLAHAGFGLPLAVYLLRNYVGSLPSSIMESAEIDGADHFTIFWRLVIPLSVPVLASFAIFQFLWVWNDYLVALIFLGSDPRVQVLTFELANLNGRGEGAYALLPAAAFVTMVLPMVVFFSLQRFFVRGLTAGSVKG
jgi:alpha-glucoside transport system permease protein